MTKLPRFDKYALYTRAVQDPPAMCDFLYNIYRELFRREPRVLGEDFCGAFALASEWVREVPKRAAVAVDIDNTPLAYGRRRNESLLTREELGRLRVLRKDVRKAGLPGADILCALNFSYGVFYSRTELRDYLARSLKRLGRHGMLALDCLGGVESGTGVQNQLELNDFTYTWEQASFDPFTRRARFFIHFEREGEKERRRVFTYDWRMWTVMELRELLEEVGFRKTHLYWQGSGQLTERFNPRKDGPECFQSWVAYVVGEK